MNKPLRSVSMLAIVIHSMVGLRLLQLPRDIAEYAENDAWASVLLGTVLAIFIGYGFYWLATKYPMLTYPQITEAVLGKILGKLILVGIGVYTITTVSIGTRAFADGIKLFLLDSTPLYVVIVVMLGLLTYCVAMGIKTVSVVFDMLLPFVLMAVVLLFFFGATNIDMENLLPVFNGGMKPIFQGFLEISHPILGLAFIGFIMPYFQNLKEVKKWIGIGIAIVTIIYLGIVILCLMVFGSKELQMLTYPTLTLLKAVQLETEIFERIESLFIAIWVPITFTTLVVFYFASYLNLKTLFETNRDKLIIFGLVPILFVLAMVPSSVAEVVHYLDLINKLAQGLIFIKFPLLLIVAFIKTRGQKSDNQIIP